MARRRHHRGSCHGRWGGSGASWEGPAGIGAAVVCVFGVWLVTWIQDHPSHPIVLVAFFAVLGGSVWLVARSIGSRQQREVSPERLADVTGMRLAIDAGVAQSLVAALTRALGEPEHRRLARVAEILLEARPRWRLAALDATPPLPEPKARKLFEAWADDVRKRFAPRASLPPDDLYRASALVVVCLHVETSEEIRDVAGPSGEAVERTLRQLASGAQKTVRRVDLWGSEPLTAADLAAMDHTLQPVSD